MSKFTHFDEQGNAIMVDVSQKAKTQRLAVAVGKISMSAQAFGAIKSGDVAKGDVLGTARLAGIMGTKQTASLIPLCHILPLEQAAIDFVLDDEKNEIMAKCLVRATDKTGVEMEALMGASIALLTIYDMCKAVDKTMVISDICLLEKHGGKSGTFKREETGQ